MVTKPEAPAPDAAISELKQDLDQLRADFARLIETLKDTAKAGVSEASGEAQAAAGEALDWAGTKRDGLAQTIRTQPLLSCAVAAGLGLVVGQILLRR